MTEVVSVLLRYTTAYGADDLPPVHCCPRRHAKNTDLPDFEVDAGRLHDAQMHHSYVLGDHGAVGEDALERDPHPWLGPVPLPVAAAYAVADVRQPQVKRL